MGRVIGLDTLRFVAAIWVFLFHWGVSVDRARLSSFYGSVFCGPAAVIVFFVISGFCIHYPYKTAKEEVHIFPFLIRRYLRIGLPLLVAMFLTRGFNITVESLINAVGWSIIIELIFYSIYPFLRMPLTASGWLDFLFCFFILGFIVVLLRNPGVDYGSWGHEYNWLLALPCWLLGCRLATVKIESSKPSGKFSKIWLFRFAVWCASALACFLHYHGGIYYPWTLNSFAVLVYFWIQEELKCQQFSFVSRFLEWGGKWSYSLYLMHPFGLNMSERIAMPSIGVVPNIIIKAFLVLSICYIFYFVVEKPSHAFSRWFSSMVEKHYPFKRLQ